MDTGLLKFLLTWVLSGGSGLLAYWLVERIKWLISLDPEPKRYAAYGISAVIAVLTYLGQIGMTYAVAPVGWRGWVEAIVAVMGLACGVSQITHGMRKLHIKRHIGLGYASVGRQH